MHSNSTWRTQEDFMADIMAISEIEGISRHQVEEPPPASILEYRARMAANNASSIYDSPRPDDEGVTYIISGRGRGGISTILRPGVSQLSDSLVTEDVKKKLRQVSGLGYSNAMIMQGVRAMTIANNKNKNATSSPAKEASNGTCVKQSSPHKTPLSPVGKEQNSTSRASSCSTLSATSPHPAAEEEPASNPLPLSVMMKLAREQRIREKERKLSEEASSREVNKNEKLPKRKSPRRSPMSLGNGHGSPLRNASSASSSDESGVWGRVNIPDQFFQANAKSFNIDDSNDFPALK